MTTWIPDDLWPAVRALMDERGVSVDEVVRDALASYLAQVAETEVRPVDATERLDAIQARVDAAPNWPAETVTKWGRQTLDTSAWTTDQWNAMQPQVIAFVAAARQDVLWLVGLAHRQDAALRAVLDVGQILAAHQIESTGMSWNSPDRCACGVQTMPPRDVDDPRDIRTRRFETFALHQQDVVRRAIESALGGPA